MKKTFYVTTPIYYPSGNLHIGHVYTTTLADALTRYKKLQGFDTYFLTGSDEHGKKILEKTEKMGLKPITYLDQEIKKFKDLWTKLDIEYDIFQRTTFPDHIKTCQKIFSKLLAAKHIYKGHYNGKYCVPCESSWQISELVEKDNKKTCPDCFREVDDLKEESYFLNFQKQEAFIKKLFANDFLFPVSNIKELEAKFLKKGLLDLSISRTSFDWGVPILEDPKHIMYVWLDALPNYISALGYLQEDDSLFKKFWNDEGEILHIVGKEITRFHCIYWPIILNYLNILPKSLKVLGHGWITSEKRKMSKSLGNVIDPIALLEKYSFDHIKYYLVKEIMIGQDGDFSQERFINTYNSDLANGYGNLVSRTMTMLEKYCHSKIPKFINIDDARFITIDEDIKESLQEYTANMDNYNITNAIKDVNKLVEKTNLFINAIKPWTLEKKDQEIIDQTLLRVIKAIEVCALMYSPVLTKGSELVFKQLNIPKKDFSSCLKYDYLENVQTNKKINLYPRIKD